MGAGLADPDLITIVLGSLLKSYFPLINVITMSAMHAKASLNPFEAIPNIPVTIFILSEEANPTGFTRAWGASLVLLSAILFASLAARALLARSRARMAR